jgi:WD40 repeat protein
MTDIEKGKLPELYRSLQGHNDTIRTISFCSNSRQLATASGDSYLYLWNLQAKNIQAKKLSGHTAAITEVNSSNLDRVRSIRQYFRFRLYGQDYQSLE